MKNIKTVSAESCSSETLDELRRLERLLIY